MRVLVTGGTGLVGCALQKVIAEGKELDEWIFVSSKDANLLNKEQVEQMFEKHKPTHVIHLAAKVGGLFANMKYKVDFFRENLYMNDNVMEACRKYKVEKLLTCLSTCIFPSKVDKYPIDESMLHQGAADKSNYGYAMAKRMVDVANHCYREQYGLNYISLAPGNLYGPWDNFTIEGGHVIPGLIHKCYLAKRDNADFSIWGSGKPLRQFLFAEDFARILLWIVKNYNDPETVICCTEEETSIGDVADIIAKETEFKGKSVRDTSKSDGQFKRTVSNQKLMKLMPDFKFTPIKDGIMQTVKWFSENYENARK